MAEFALESPVKILCPVRDVAEILASFEKLWRKVSSKSQHHIETNEYMLAQTVGGRCEILSRMDQTVGLAYNRIKDALIRGHGDKIKLIEFDNLTSNRESTLSGIYEFLGMNNFQHDFENVAQYTSEKDQEIHGVEGLHSIRQKVEPSPKYAQQILGTELAEKYKNIEPWR
jgi:sulfotransferase